MNKTKRLLISMLTLLFCCTGMWAVGELNGVFTISASGGKVQFSQGNLQYQASTNTWRFATNQYDYIGKAAGNTSPSSSQTEWIDYFNWGTSGYDHGANCYRPWSTSKTQSDYYAYGSSSKNLYDAKDDNSMRGQADWGYNAISNGGNTENSGWRILTKDEWAYLINTRSETYRYAKGTIHGTNGLMLFPDGFTLPTGVSISNANTAGASYTSYSNDTWTALEAAGVVFLPATGLRNGTSVEETGTIGNYWSSTCMNADRVYNIRFDGSSLILVNDGDRQNGFPVRLVKSNLKQDGEGNFLIGSVQDWNDFATIVNNGINRTANAKMTADIDLGTDATMVGNANTNPYQGVFNGQGHKLTVNWTVNGGGDGVAPFRYIDGATIQKLHVDGSISATGSIQRAAASHAAFSIGNATSTISECWSSASITGYDTMGGIFGVANGTSTVNITDCLFTGSIHPTNEGEGCCAGFASQAMKDGSNVPTINITRGLYLGSYTGSTVRCYNFVRNDYPDWFGVHTVTDCYYKNVYGTAQGTQASNDNLADGTTTTALNDERTGEAAPWVQDPVSKQPRLKQFVLQQDGSGNFLIGSVQNWKDFATLVKTNPAINAKMTADINLGTDKTMAGTSSSNYQGVFDGQGHTITINFEVTENYLGLFRYISGATIKNLHVTGTISTNYYGYAGGIVGVASGTSTIQNCQSSVNIQSTIVGDGVLGGIVACSAPENSGATLNINDCLFNGSMYGPSTMTCGGFVAWRYDGNTVNISNSLFLPTSANVSTTYSACFVGHGATSLTKCYHKTVIGTVQGVEATAENLADGTTTAALNNGRKNGPWVQDAVSGEPRLDLFMATTSLTANEGKTGEYWSTYYDGAKSSIADANTTVYTGKVNGDKIDLTEIVDKTIPAGNAVILKSTAANVTLTKTSATGTLANNDLKGVDVATAKTDVYCLSKNTVVGFYKFTGDVPAHRAYIEIVSSAPMLGFDDGGTTEISTLNIERGTLNDGSWYTLDGRQLNAQPTRKGIYVRNGKKFIVK